MVKFSFRCFLAARFFSDTGHQIIAARSHEFSAGFEQLVHGHEHIQVCVIHPDTAATVTFASTIILVAPPDVL